MTITTAAAFASGIAAGAMAIIVALRRRYSVISVRGGSMAFLPRAAGPGCKLLPAGITLPGADDEPSADGRNCLR